MMIKIIYVVCCVLVVECSSKAKRADDTPMLESIIMQQGEQLQHLTAELAALRTEVNALKIVQGGGSTFIRWGRTVCTNDSRTIYSGIVGGSRASDTGAAANKVCLTAEPVFDNDTLVMNGGHGSIYGAEYFIPDHVETDASCALCHASFSVTFMVPGTNRCPMGATLQYDGYLTMGNFGHAAASEYLCLDSSPEDREGSLEHQDGAWFDQTLIVCGSLPCPPYQDGGVVLCAVCSQ